MSEENTPGASGTPEAAPQYITADQVNAIVTAAVTSHLKRGLPKAFEEFAPKFKEMIGGALAEQAKAAPATPANAPGTPSLENRADPKLLALEQSHKDLIEKLNASESRREAAERKQRDDSAYSTLRGELQKHNVRPEMLDVAAKYLFHAEGRVKFGEDGTPLFLVRKSPAPGMPEEDLPVPLSDGVNMYVRSKEAAMFLPAPTAAPTRPGAVPTQGWAQARTGARPDNTPATTDAERARRAFADEQAVAKILQQQDAG